MQKIPIVKDELIGKHVTIAQCTDPTWQDVHGVVVDETYQTLVIETKKGKRRIAKQSATFIFHTDCGKLCSVHGSRIQYRPEDRIKKAR